MTSNQTEKNCVICKEKFTGYGNNPQPLAKSGECCDSCNRRWVFYYRMMYRYQRFKCPKCKKDYTPKYKSREEAEENGDTMDIEQHMSHICSNECWYACSEEEIIKYKYYNPLNAHRPEHIIHISSTQN